MSGFPGNFATFQKKPRVTCSLTLTALIGDPVEHSLSDTMFARYARETRVGPYAHVKIRIPKSRKDLLGYAIRGLAALGFAGCNVTIPYKTEVAKKVDQLQGSAKIITTVNTIKVSGDTLLGFNTDGAGALRSMDDEARPIESDDRVVVFGAGGAARAIVYEVMRKTNHITIVNRTRLRAIQMAKMLKRVYPLAKPLDLQPLALVRKDKRILTRLISNANIIIHATPVGMAPQSGGCILSPNAFAQSDLDGKIFFDAIYNPLQTVFLKSAQLAGAHTISGLGMMLHQGREAFRLWTNEIVPSEALKTTRELLESQIDRTRGRT